MSHGYEQTSVSDMRKILNEEYQISQTELLGKTKLELVAMLKECSNTNDISDEIEPEILEEAVEDIQQDAQDNTPLIPNPNDENWTSYVLDLLRADELFDGRPTCDGLRRITEFLIGKILGREILFVSPPTQESNMTATISVSIKVAVEDNTGYWGYAKIIEEQDIADSGPFNSDIIYSKYPSAMAMTRAEGRCLRRILRLKTITSEESSDTPAISQHNDSSAMTVTDEWIPEDKISEEQKNVVLLLCKQCNININEFINCGKEKFTSLEHVTKAAAVNMIKYLNAVRSGEKKYETA